MSVLRRPNYEHPFAPFIADDLAGIERVMDEGFDPFWFDERGMTCAMEAAIRGNSEALHLALARCSDPLALASLRSDSDLDAFDLAAASGAVACMSVLSKVLPRDYRSSIGRGFMWHAVQASSEKPAFADAWLADLCMDAGRALPVDMAQALMLARELSWQPGIDRLEAVLSKKSAD